MKIQERLASLRPYVSGIRYVNELSVVDTTFKDSWVVEQTDSIRFKKGSKNQNYYMFFTDNVETSFDDILDHVEFIIKTNLEQEEKKVLFKDTIDKLKTLFTDNSLKDLKTLKIEIPKDELDIENIELGKPKTKRKDKQNKSETLADQVEKELQVKEG